jgi:hypothetical protein
MDYSNMEIVKYTGISSQGFDEETQKQIDELVDFSWRIYNMYNTIDGLEPLSTINANTYRSKWLKYCGATGILTSSVKEYIKSRGRVHLKTLVNVHHHEKHVVPVKRIEIKLCEFSSSPLSDSEFQSRLANVVRQLELECTQNEYNDRTLLNLTVAVSYSQFSVLVLYQTLQDSGILFDRLLSDFQSNKTASNAWYRALASEAIDRRCKHHGFVIMEDGSPDCIPEKLKGEDFYCFLCSEPVICMKSMQELTSF